jgi:serine/threonine protein kinase/Rieske Fe-S protein
MQTQSVDQLVGQILGHYRVERLLGQGRLNAVYLAWHLEMQKHVALTLLIIPEHFTPGARNRFIQRFRKEAAALTTLQHPHILPVYEYGEFMSYPYLVTPYMMNGSLADVLKQQGRFAHDEVLEVLEQVVAGLEFAHGRGFIHGTLRPSNMVLSAEQTMLVAGFGLMHIQQVNGIEKSDQPYAHLLSVAGTFLAASEYLAPEVVQGQSIDARSDIYALGCILFELLSGKPPFKGANPLETANLHVQQPAPSLRSVAPDVPVALASVVNQALEHDPKRRFQHVNELAEAFAQASWGATGSLRSVNGQVRKTAPLTHGETSQALPGPSRSGSTTNTWQLLPPIVTDKSAAIKLSTPRTSTTKPQVSPTSKPAASRISAPLKSAATENYGSTGSWQLSPPIITGNLPAVNPSISSRESSGKLPTPLPRSQAAPPAAMSRANFAPDAPPSPAPVSRNAAQYDEFGNYNNSEWWSQASQEPFRGRYPEPFGWPNEPPRERPIKKRSRGMSRRKAIALLATGSVVAAGAVVAVNTNLLHMVNNTLKTPTTKAGNTATTNNNQQTAKTTPAKQQQTAAHTGTVVGSKTLALNSSQAFINPADKQASVLIHLPDGSFVAYERACTHVGVRVNYDPATHTLVCPAHGAVFDPANKGAVIQGPATKPLPSVTVQVNGDGTITTA